MPTKKILFFFFLILLIPLVSAELTPLNKDNLQEKNAGINPLLGDVGLGKQFSIEVIAYPELDNLKKELQKFTNYRLQISFNPEHLQHIDSQNLVPGNWVPQDNINNNDLNNPSKSGDITFAMEGSSLEDIFKSKPTSLAKFTFLTKDDLIPPQQTVISIQDLTIITTEVPIVNTLFTSTTLTVTEDDPGFDYGDIPPYTPPPEYFPVGGQSCTPEWDCSSWDFCNKDKIQARTCLDKNKCQPQKTETQSCTECQESWICSLWSDCTDDKQYRNCFDEHHCTSEKVKPDLDKKCLTLDPKPDPTKIDPNLPIPTQPVKQQPAIFIFFKDFWVYILAILIIIAVIIIATYFFKKPHPTSDSPQLKNYIKTELQNKHTETAIVERLRETSWKEQEIQQALQQAKQESQQPPRKQ